MQSCMLYQPGWAPIIEQIMDYGSKYYVTRGGSKAVIFTMMITIINDTCIENGVPRSTTLNRYRLLCPVVTVLPRAPLL